METLTNAEIANAADWQWYKGSTALSGATSATYIPQEADVGRLRVEATYNAKDNDRDEDTSITVQSAPTDRKITPRLS